MFTLPDLPFARDALQPHMSARTLEFHHGKHHKAYVDKLNALVEGTELEGKTLEEVIRRTASSTDPALSTIFNNAGQHWNHSFFWSSLAPGGDEAPSGGPLEKAIDREFGGKAALREELAAKGAAHFGSGWVWLVLDAERLEVLTTHDAATPLEMGKVPLLCCDLWEHAYYLDYQNRRPDFLEAFASHLANWRFAEANYDAAPANRQQGSTGNVAKA